MNRAKRAVTRECELATAICSAVNPRLHCNSCGREEPLTIGSTLRYFDQGWPSCCGVTLSIRAGYEVN